MYGKLFAQMYDGTLGTQGPWQALVTFQQMIILADRDGVLDMTPEALSRRTTLPIDVIVDGIKALLKADPQSRTPDEDGRRIVPLSPGRAWGWRIVNHAKYRSIRTADERRAYHRQYSAQRRIALTKDNNVNNCNITCQKQPIAEAEAEAEASVPTKVLVKDCVPKKFLKEIPAQESKVEIERRIRFGLFWSAWPKGRKLGTGKAQEVFNKIDPTDALVRQMIEAVEKQKRSDNWQRGYVPLPATWLNQQRWMDDLRESVDAFPVADDVSR